jgi:hypothetical protein
MARWELQDNTGTSKGYLRILRDGARVADAFPFAAHTNPDFIREQAQRIVDAMNEAEAIQQTPGA